MALLIVGGREFVSSSSVRKVVSTKSSRSGIKIFLFHSSFYLRCFVDFFGPKRHTDSIHAHISLTTMKQRWKLRQRQKTGGVPERGILSPLSIEPSPWLSLMYGLPQLQARRVRQVRVKSDRQRGLLFNFPGWSCNICSRRYPKVRLWIFKEKMSNIALEATPPQIPTCYEGSFT